MSALAADTDGIDGSEQNAGAWFIPAHRDEPLANLQRAKSCLSLHDAYGFFEQLDTLVYTGPTLTNVNDFRILFIDNG